MIKTRKLIKQALGYLIKILSSLGRFSEFALLFGNLNVDVSFYVIIMTDLILSA